MGFLRPLVATGDQGREAVTAAALCYLFISHCGGKNTCTRSRSLSIFISLYPCRVSQCQLMEATGRDILQGVQQERHITPFWKILNIGEYFHSNSTSVEATGLKGWSESFQHLKQQLFASQIVCLWCLLKLEFPFSSLTEEQSEMTLKT